MAPSYRVIDYRVRPSKYIERLMLCEAFSHLRFHVLKDYQYIGLGSIYFADFRLFHRNLGITRMFSIEKQKNDKKRVEWNKPYSGITVLFGESGQHLPQFDFSTPTIVWLDYDGRLVGSVISDIRTVSRAASHGTVFIVSVNSQPWTPDVDKPDMLEQVRAELTSSRIPPKTSTRSLRGWGLSQVYRHVGDSEIRDALATANGVRPKDQRMEYEQLFNFQYADGARMTTFGGVFFQEDRKDQLTACAFDRLPFIRHNGDAFRIEAPNLTLREIAYLERQLPLPKGSEIDFGYMPENDATNYINLYRYFPTFLPVAMT